VQDGPGEKRRGRVAVFSRATKKKRKLRLALVGPSGSGKTWTALTLASRIAEVEGGRVALLDTEHGSAADYADVFDFDHARMSAPYSPARYSAALNAAKEEGFGIVVIDSLSHAWDGEGGVLEIVDQASTSKFSGWRKGTPEQNRMVNAILSYPGHVIVTMRARTEYIVTPSGKPEKVGIEPVQRKGIEYEFAIVGELDLAHTLTVGKSRASGGGNSPGGGFRG
jgi:energy-coupling factor transporter ATP-binding protein EcfA2